MCKLNPEESRIKWKEQKSTIKQHTLTIIRSSYWPLEGVNGSCPGISLVLTVNITNLGTGSNVFRINARPDLLRDFSQVFAEHVLEVQGVGRRVRGHIQHLISLISSGLLDLRY